MAVPLRFVGVPPTVNCPGVATNGVDDPVGQYTDALPQGNCVDDVEPMAQ